MATPPLLRRLLPLLLCGIAAAPVALRAQGSRADYDRALSLAQRTENTLFRARVRPNWLPDRPQFWYRIETGPGSWEFVCVDAERGERRPAFDHARLATALAGALAQEIAPARLPLDNFKFTPEGDAALFRAGGKGWLWKIDAQELSPEQVEEKTLSPRRPGRAPRMSRRTGEETELVFVNRTGGDVELFWLDEQGERRGYGRVRPGDERRQHTFAGHVWLVTDSTGTVVLGVFEAADEPGRAVLGESNGTPDDAPDQPSKPAPPAGMSPDGRWIASIKDHNVLLKNAASGEESPLSTDGTKDDAFSEPFFWSPDSTHLVVMQTRPAQEHKVSFVESSPKDQLQPKLHTIDYLKPGDRVAQPQPRLFDIATRQLVPVPDALFANPFDLDEVRWAPDSSRFTFRYNQRGHQVLRIVGVDIPQGGTNAAPRAVIEETSPTFIDYSSKSFLHWLDATGEAIWMSERDGWNHLYLYDTKTGRVKNAITRGEWVVREVERVDEAKRKVWFIAGGVVPGQDPYFLHLCRVNFDGTGFRVLTEGDGTHAVEFSPDRRFFLDRWSRVDQPPITELRRSADGNRVCLLECADATAMIVAGWTVPQRFVAKARDSRTDIHGILITPSNLDPARRYPAVEEIYAGPQGAFVPKEFGRLNRQHAIAELGFVVVQIDGMGTNWRGKKFHDVCWKNLADAGFPDRVLWMQAAGASRPWMDLARVGVYGGSAGGQNAMRALLDHGDFYRAAVADCGCHDNRMDKIWWNEQWLGWPVDDSYVRSSNVADAHKLQGRLLLFVGELDNNVDPASTMQVVNALEKADKDYDLVVMTGTGHGSAETPYGNRRRMDFLVRHLLGHEPRWVPEARP